MTAPTHPLILGALTADAAAMGLHWIYDQDHIARIAPEAPEFRAPSAADYDGVKGYFAHAGCASGDPSQYGEQLQVLMRALAANGGAYDAEVYASAFRAHFGYGGAYVGYIDRATRESLNNIVGVDDPAPHLGSNDVQLPAVSKLPALVAAMADADDDTFNAAVTSAVSVTNRAPMAVDYGHIAARMMLAALSTNDVTAIVSAGRAVASPEAAALLDEATVMSERSANEVAQHFGLACNLIQGVPVAVHIIMTAPSYAEAIRANIYAGGDTCGRAILIGAVLGATYGVGGDKGIPQEWVERLTFKGV